MPFPKIRFVLPLAMAMILSATAQGGTFMPEMAPFVTRINVASETNLTTQGLVAFVWTWPPLDAPDQTTVNGKSAGAPRRDISVRMDVKNLETGNLYRIDLQPDFLRLGTFLKGGDPALDNISDSVAFFALPPGRYAPHYAEMKVTDEAMTGGYLTGSEFTVDAGVITSFGRVEILFARRLFRLKLRIATLPDSDIETGIRASRNPSISVMPITRQTLEAAPAGEKEITR